MKAKCRIKDEVYTIGVNDKTGFIKSFGHITLTYCNHKQVPDNIKSEKNMGYLRDFYIEEEYRRQGFGEQLLRDVITISKKKGLVKLKARVRIKNIPSINLFKKVGFTIDETDDDPLYKDYALTFVMCL